VDDVSIRFVPLKALATGIIYRKKRLAHFPGGHGIHTAPHLIEWHAKYQQSIVGEMELLSSDETIIRGRRAIASGSVRSEGRYELTIRSRGWPISL